MVKSAKISLLLSIIHFGIVGIFFVLMFTIGNIPGPMHPVMIPFLFYMFFSFIIPITIIIYCIIGLKRDKINPINIICMILALIYIIAFFTSIVIMFPRWMSI